jgi:hypothetical protein
MTELQPVKAFLDVADRTLSFLVTDVGLMYEKQRLGASWIAARYRGRSVIIQFALDSNIYILAEIIALQDGREPRRFEADLREHLTNLDLAELLAILDPTWSAPARPTRVRDRQDMVDVLSAYASALRRHLSDVLEPDERSLERVRVNMRRRMVFDLLKYWSEFVSDVRRGYAAGVGEYTRAISTRATLEDLAEWRDPVVSESRAQLLELDALFDEVTDPIPWGPSNLLPTPRAARWWRKPRSMTNALRQEFRAYGI